MGPMRVALGISFLTAFFTGIFYILLRQNLIPGAEKFGTATSPPLPYREIGRSAPPFDKPSTESKNVTQKNASSQSSRDQYTIEVKAFANRTEAEQYVDHLVGRGLNAYYTPLQSEDGRVIYRVRLGVFPSYTMAEKVSLQIKKDQNISNQIVRLQ